MPYVASIGSYLPCWGSSQHQVAGDADAVERVVLVSRELPLLESSNAAVLSGWTP